MKLRCIKLIPGKRVFSLKPVSPWQAYLVFKHRSNYPFRFALSNAVSDDYEALCHEMELDNAELL